MSIASTIDVDNTSCYLKKFADQFAQEVKTQDVGEQHPMFVRINKFKFGQVVLYTGNGSYDQARIADVYYESNSLPRYTIELSDGFIEVHVSEDQLERWDKTKVLERNDSLKSCTKSLPPPIPTLDDSPSRMTSKVVNFNSKSNELFSLLYSGKFNEAKNRLRTHPDETSQWVIRYGKNTKHEGLDGTNHASHNAIRWKLLPLHLFILLAGSHDYTNRFDGNQMREKLIPQIDLLTALLSAYPHATECIDDKHIIPLHSSIRGQSSPCIIKALIEVNPGSVLLKDTKGRDSFALLDQVVKKQMKHERTNAAATYNGNVALRVKEWKQEVLLLLTEAIKQGLGPDDSKYKGGEGNHQPEDPRVTPKETKETSESQNASKEMTSSGSLEERNDADVKYLQVHFHCSNENSAAKDITPCSTMTSTTEFTTPTSTENKKHQCPDASARDQRISNWETRCHVLGLESYVSGDNENMLLCDGGRGTAISTETQITDFSSIFRDRLVHLGGSGTSSHFIAGNNVGQEATSSSAKDKTTVFDSSLILAAMFSYESEDDDKSNIKSGAFSKDAIPPI